jgi:hypothetical protein
MTALDREPDDSRLRSALKLVHSIGSMDGGLDDARRATELHFAIELADQLGHTPTSALLRLREAEDLSVRQQRIRDARQAVESALPMLDSMYEVDSGWREIRLQGYGLWKRLDAAERGEPPTVIDTDGSEEEAAIQLNELLGSRAIAERSGETVSFKVPELTLDDIAWNAVLVGRQPRFKKLRARMEVAVAVTAKLERAGCLAVVPSPAQTLLCGLLDHLWRGLTPLDAEIMHRSAAMFTAGVEDISIRGLKSPDDPWLDAALRFEEETRSWVSESTTFPVHDLDASLRQSRRALWHRWQELGAPVAETDPSALPAFCAYTLGAIIEAYACAPEEEPARSAILGNLHALLTLVDGSVEHEGLLAGYEPPTVKDDELDRWRREEGLTRESVTPVRWG